MKSWSLLNGSAVTSLCFLSVQWGRVWSERSSAPVVRTRLPFTQTNIPSLYSVIQSFIQSLCWLCKCFVSSDARRVSGSAAESPPDDSSVVSSHWVTHCFTVNTRPTNEAEPEPDDSALLWVRISRTQRWCCTFSLWFCLVLLKTWQVEIQVVFHCTQSRLPRWSRTDGLVAK